MLQNHRREKKERRRHAAIALRHLGFYIVEDTDKSPMRRLRNALARFQVACHTKRTGRLDRQTYSTLLSTYEENLTSNSDAILQDTWSPRHSERILGEALGRAEFNGTDASGDLQFDSITYRA